MQADELQAMKKRLASEANNQAWTLAEQGHLTDEEKRTLLCGAAASAWLWLEAGGDQQAAMADLLLARALARCGCGEGALTYARRCQGYLLREGSAAWERAFAHAALSDALRLTGDLEGAKQERALAETAASLLDGEDAELFGATWQVIPAPEG